MALSKIDSDGIVSGGITADSLNIGQIGGRRNLIINGAMQVAQRGTSFSSQSTSLFPIDHFYAEVSVGTHTFSQATDTPSGFSNSLKIECTTAEATPSAGNALAIFYQLEGKELQQLAKGTSDAKEMTLSFWVKSSNTGTTQVYVRDVDNSRGVGATYTINSADTWEYKTMTFPADTTGAFDNDVNKSAQIEWWLDSGSSYQGGTVPTAWEALDNTDRNPNNLDIGGTIGNTFQITGVQLEVGNVATPFEHRSYGEELALCQRYFQTGGNCTGRAYGSANLQAYYQFPVQMRATPTTTQRGDGTSVSMDTGIAHCAGLASYNITAISASQPHPSGVLISATTSGGMPNPDLVGLRGNPANFDAEL